MSVLNRVKSIIFNELKTTDPKVKKGLLKIWNRIDSELDEEGYTPSAPILEAIIELDDILVELHPETADSLGEIVPPITVTKPRVINRNDDEDGE